MLITDEGIVHVDGNFGGVILHPRHTSDLVKPNAVRFEDSFGRAWVPSEVPAVYCVRCVVGGWALNPVFEEFVRRAQDPVVINKCFSDLDIMATIDRANLLGRVQECLTAVRKELTPARLKELKCILTRELPGTVHRKEWDKEPDSARTGQKKFVEDIQDWIFGISA